MEFPKGSQVRIETYLFSLVDEARIWLRGELRVLSVEPLWMTPQLIVAVDSNSTEPLCEYRVIAKGPYTELFCDQDMKFVGTYAEPTQGNAYAVFISKCE